MKLIKLQIVYGHLYGLTQAGLRLGLYINENGLEKTRADAATIWANLAPLPSDIHKSSSDASLPKLNLFDLVIEGLLRLQISAGMPVVSSAVIEDLVPFTTNTSDRRQLAHPAFKAYVLIPTSFPKALYDIAQAVIDHVNTALTSTVQNVNKEPSLAALKNFVDRLSHQLPPGTNQRHFLRSAVRLNIPVITLPALVAQFGWGKRSRLFDSSLSDATPAVATKLSKDKRATNALLRMGGLPVPLQKPVSSLGEALDAAKDIGYPVVLKPSALDKGLGVEADLHSEVELTAAFPRSRAHSHSLVLEEHISGEDYRVYVVQGKVIAVAHRIPAQIIGDGSSTVTQLLDAENARRKALRGNLSTHQPIMLDDEALDLLKRQNLTPKSVPQTNQNIRLRRSANSSRGGNSIDVTPLIHPDNEELCVNATALLRLDIAGLDFLMPDISQSWRDIGGAICEFNAQPQMGAAHPWIFEKILESFVFRKGRIPIVLLLGQTENRDIVKTTQETLKCYGLAPKFICGEGAALLQRGREALLNPKTGSVFIQTVGKELIQYGLPVDRVDILILPMHEADTIIQSEFMCLLAPHVGIGTILYGSQSDQTALALLRERITPHHYHKELHMASNQNEFELIIRKYCQAFREE